MTGLVASKCPGPSPLAAIKRSWHFASLREGLASTTPFARAWELWRGERAPRVNERSSAV